MVSTKFTIQFTIQICPAILATREIASALVFLTSSKLQSTCHIWRLHGQWSLDANREFPMMGISDDLPLLPSDETRKRLTWITLGFLATNDLRRQLIGGARQ